MKLSTLLSIASVYMVLAGLGFILFPQAFGRGAVPSDASPALIAYLRLIGSPMLGISVLNWMSRKEGPSTARNAIIIGNTVGFAVIAALDIWGLFNDARPATKVFVVIHLLFTLAFLILGRKNILKG
ncbi:hypothetical protein LQ567_00540 [Niabella pedocola]|uniref:EamA domain-containing protein n=1 Tax=Niabella pedocola TaxID=1752077 RepID=A0ABS8PJF1_9BACT|nr:hypothetical protein [Niabella pedocola]MCD2421229.1 hypothetical protein [Niabella pedocola]